MVTGNNKLKGLPEELLRDIGPICETLSLATLQSSMPNSKHWEGMGSGSGLGPGKPSPYVGEFISKDSNTEEFRNEIHLLTSLDLSR